MVAGLERPAVPHRHIHGPLARAGVDLGRPVPGQPVVLAPVVVVVVGLRATVVAGLQATVVAGLRATGVVVPRAAVVTDPRATGVAEPRVAVAPLGYCCQVPRAGQRFDWHPVGADVPTEGLVGGDLVGGRVFGRVPGG